MFAKSKVLVKLVRMSKDGRLQSDHTEMLDCRAFRLCDPSQFILLAVDPGMDEHHLRGWIKRLSMQGFKWNGTTYAFLGLTDEHIMSRRPRVVFFKEDDKYTADTLLSAIGDLKTVYCDSGYSKYATCLQLAFTGSVCSLDIKEEDIKQIQDIKAHDESIHSDGIGMIRDSFAAEICAHHDLPSTTSAFSIQRGGIKGVLVRYPDEFFDKQVGTSATTHPYKIAYRPSMLKFLGGPTELEIVWPSYAPRPAHLNIRLILLLLTLGVPVKVFQRLLAERTAMIEGMLADRESAMQCIRHVMYGTLEDDNWGQRVYTMLAAQHKMEEPYVHNELLKLQRWQYKDLSKKLNARVEKAAYVMGVIDELGVLKEGEVFMKYTTQGDALGKKLVGDVLITRMPCFAPGDLRKFRAVECPALDHLENVVVFSQKAKRSIPDTIASGDLDGDLYLVIWEPELIPAKEVPPVVRSRPSTAPKARDQSHTLDNMKNEAVHTLIKYRIGDIVSKRLYNRWVSAAQATSQLVNSPLSKALIALNEDAVDMVKHNRHPKTIDSKYWKLIKEHKTIDDPSANTDNSITLLRSQLKEQQNDEPLRQDSWEIDDVLIIKDQNPDLWEEELKEVEKIMAEFNKELSKAIRRDMLTDTVRDRGDARHAFLLQKTYASKYFPGEDDEKERIRASAWYQYAYSKQKTVFAWLGAKYLNAIRAEYVKGSQEAAAPFTGLSDWDEVVMTQN